MTQSKIFSPKNVPWLYNVQRTYNYWKLFSNIFTTKIYSWTAQIGHIMFGNTCTSSSSNFHASKYNISAHKYSIVISAEFFSNILPRKFIAGLLKWPMSRLKRRAVLVQNTIFPLCFLAYSLYHGLKKI